MAERVLMPAVLITGAGRGIGLEFARQYAADGWTVLATVRDPAKGAPLAALGKQVEVHLLDVTDRPAIAMLAHELDGRAIDILICNAGIYGNRSKQEFGAVDWAEWEAVLKTNVMAPLALAECFVDHVARSERKLIVMMTSQMASTEEASGGAYVYRSSKAALNNVAKNLSEDLAARGITVIAMDPGWVKTDMGGASAPLTPEYSVRNMRKMFAKAGRRQTGHYLRYDGATHPW
ncbi:MAG TPA: SDR family oxidoreductase [Alphaproteobacteria bacterium]|nr:SDR family oxidoreductase [Alphaproteobacteria bacterium]